MELIFFKFNITWWHVLFLFFGWKFIHFNNGATKSSIKHPSKSEWNNNRQSGSQYTLFNNFYCWLFHIVCCDSAFSVHVEGSWFLACVDCNERYQVQMRQALWSEYKRFTCAYESVCGVRECRCIIVTWHTAHTNRTTNSMSRNVYVFAFVETSHCCFLYIIISLSIVICVPWIPTNVSTPTLRALVVYSPRLDHSYRIESGMGSLVCVLMCSALQRGVANNNNKRTTSNRRKTHIEFTNFNEWNYK